MFSALAYLWKACSRVFVVLDKSVKIIENEVDLISEGQNQRMKDSQNETKRLPAKKS